MTAFEIVPEPEFSAWFESLSESDAEEVAGALEVIASVGRVLKPARVSTALLWYDGLAVGEASPDAENLALYLRGLGLDPDVSCWLQEELGVAPPSPRAAERAEHILSVADQVHDLVSWEADMLRALESRKFLARLERLPSDVAATVLRDVAHLEQRIHAVRFSMLLRLESAMHDTSWRDVVAALEESVTSILALAGIEHRSIEFSNSGLRELTLTSTSPKLRVLFGIDGPRGRVIAIVGEPLIRKYYGDTVRLAERRWAAYRHELESARAP